MRRQALRNQRRDAAAGQCRGRRRVKACAIEQGVLASALDKVLDRITRIVHNHEQQERLQEAQRKAHGQPVTAEVVPVGKQVCFTGSRTARRRVKVPMGASPAALAGRGLGDYLALPLDQYSLLDPRWITKPDPGGDEFVLKVPLKELLNVQLHPRVTVQVQVDPELSQVRLAARSFQLGDPRLDTCFSVDMDVRLSHEPPSEPSLGHSMASALRAWQRDLAVATGLQGPVEDAHSNHQHLLHGSAAPSPNHHHQRYLAGGVSSAAALGGPSATEHLQPHAGSHANAKRPHGGSSAFSTTSLQQQQAVVAGAEEAGSLCCQVDLRFGVTLPPPLSAVPSPLLALAGSLLSRLAVGALLPGFLDLLATDYKRWALGSPARGKEAAGSLLGPAIQQQQQEQQQGQAGKATAARLGTAMAGLAAAAAGVSASTGGAPPPGA